MKYTKRTAAEWREFEKTYINSNAKRYLFEYSAFMYNLYNIHNCEYCPLNIYNNTSLPCGLMTCQVKLNEKRGAVYKD